MTENEELRALYRGYVGLLRSSRNRIMALGGDCDPVDRMEEGDPALIRARAALSRPSPEAFDLNVDRLKACEAIADGEDGWEAVRNMCPSTAAVASLRDQVSSRPSPEAATGDAAYGLYRRIWALIDAEHYPTMDECADILRASLGAMGSATMEKDDV